MTHTTHTIAGRVGRWSATHRRLAIVTWLAFVIASVAIGMSVGRKSIDQNNENVGQSHRADVILKQAGFPQSGPLTEIVLIQDRRHTLADPAFRAGVTDVVGAVRPFGAVHHLRAPTTAAHHDLVSADGHTALVEWDMSGTLKHAEQEVGPLTSAVAGVAKGHPGMYIGEAGAVSSTKALDKLFNEQLGQAGSRSVPLTLLILLAVFGSLLAAWIPLMLALQAVAATIGLTAIISHLTPMDQNVGAVVLLIGLAVGVDYTLFYLRREREERAAGRSEQASIAAAAATSGRAVLISGVTVMIAMAGMLLTGDQTFISFSVATMTVVAVAMLGSLTVLPAVLAKLGDRVERGRIPLLGRLRRPAGEGRVWPAILRVTMRRPAASAAATAAVLVALAIPTLHIHTAQSSLDSLPRSTPTVEALDRIQAAFPGQSSPAIIAVRTPTDAPAFAAAVAGLRRAAASSGVRYGRVSVESNPSHTAARITIPLPGNGADATSNRSLVTLRDRLLPPTIGAVAGAAYAVTGQTASSYDWNEMMKSSLPLVFGFVLTFAFLLLLASFRSVVIAAKAVILNLLSVVAAYGVVVAVFQYGWGQSLLGFRSDGAVAPWLPVFLFVILFGLSMDYHVFIVSRVREAHDRGMSTTDAVTHGITTTAGTVTAAAVVMAGAFSIFATLPILDLKEMGVGLSAAVLIDATLVRGVLLPASMSLLGDWNWYLPRWLGWLPQLERSPRPRPGAVIGSDPVAAPVG